MFSALKAGEVFRNTKLVDFQKRVALFDGDAELHLLLAQIAAESAQLDELSHYQQVK